MLNRHSLQYSELLRHRRGSIHLKRIERSGICWPGNSEWLFASVTKVNKIQIVSCFTKKTQNCIHYILPFLR